MASAETEAAPAAAAASAKYEIPSGPSLNPEAAAAAPAAGRAGPPSIAHAIAALNLFKLGGAGAGRGRGRGRTTFSDTAVLNGPPAAPSDGAEPAATGAAGAAAQPTPSDPSPAPEPARKGASKWRATAQVVAKQTEAVSTWKDVVKEGRTFRNLIAWSSSNIVKYDVNKLLSYGFLVWADGTAITGRTLFSTLVYCALATVLGYFRCPEDAPLSWDNKCVPVFGPEMLELTSLVAFLLGMFCQLTFDRWWDTRERLQSVIGPCNNISLMASTCITGTDEDARRARREVARYCNCAHALLYMQASGQEDIDSLVARKLLTKAEAAMIRSLPSKYQIVHAWLSELLKECAVSGHMLFPDGVFPQFQEQINLMRDATGEIMMFLNCQIPYAYVHLLTFATKLHLLFFMVYAAGLIGAAFNKQSSSMMAVAYVFLFVNRVIYEGLLTIYEVLVNPFGDDPDDFPKYVYQEIVEQTTGSLIDQANRMPSTGFFEKRATPAASAPASVVLEGYDRDRDHPLRRASSPQLPRRPSYPSMGPGHGPGPRPPVFRNSTFAGSIGGGGGGGGGGAGPEQKAPAQRSEYPPPKSVDGIRRPPRRSHSISGPSGVRSPPRSQVGPVLAVRPPSFGPGSSTVAPAPEGPTPAPAPAGPGLPPLPPPPTGLGPALGLGPGLGLPPRPPRGSLGVGDLLGVLGPSGLGTLTERTEAPERSASERRSSRSDGEHSSDAEGQGRGQSGGGTLRGSRSARTARSDRGGKKSARFDLPPPPPQPPGAGGPAAANGRRQQLPPIAPLALQVSPPPEDNDEGATTDSSAHRDVEEGENDDAGKAQAAPAPAPAPAPGSDPALPAGPSRSRAASIRDLPPLRLHRMDQQQPGSEAPAPAAPATSRRTARDRQQQQQTARSAREEAISRASTARGLRSNRSPRHGDLMDIAAQAAHAVQVAAAALNEIAAFRLGVQAAPEGGYGAPHAYPSASNPAGGSDDFFSLPGGGGRRGSGGGTRPGSRRASDAGDEGEDEYGPVGPYPHPDEEEAEPRPQAPAPGPAAAPAAQQRPDLKRSNSRFSRMLSFGGRFQLQSAVPTNQAF